MVYRKAAAGSLSAYYDKMKKDSCFRAVFLGEGIFTMGYSKNYIMYWGVT